MARSSRAGRIFWRIAGAALAAAALLCMVGATPIARSYACGSGRQCGTVFASSRSTDQAAVEWLSREIHAHPNRTEFHLTVRRWTLDSFLDDDTDDIDYSVREQRIDAINNQCGCNHGWDHVTPDKLHALAARHAELSDLDKLGCPSFP